MSAQTSFLDDQDTFNSLCSYWQSRHSEYLECLRAHAVRLAKTKGDVAIDDLRIEMESLRLPMPSDIGADARMLGAVLRGCKDLRPVGMRLTERTERVKRSGRGSSMITVFRLENSL